MKSLELLFFANLSALDFGVAPFEGCDMLRKVSLQRQNADGRLHPPTLARAT
jgi:hypothetical protein